MPGTDRRRLLKSLVGIGVAGVAGCNSRSSSGSERRTRRAPSAVPSGPTKLTPAEGNAVREFGGSVAIDGDTVLVGAPRWLNQNGVRTGSVHAFVRSGGELRRQATIVPADGVSNGHFGTSVALWRDTAIVGSSRDDRGGTGPETGAAYIYERTDGAWVKRTKLKPDRLDENGNFGISVALSDGTAVVGAPTDDGSIGTAYVYERSNGGWNRSGVLESDVREAGDAFGIAVAIAGNEVVVGARGHRTGGDYGTGATFVFERTRGGWNQNATLAPSGDDVRVHEFGTSVASSGGTVLVGSPLGQADEVTGGTAAVFVRPGGSWQEETTLVAEDADDGDRFGSAVAIWQNVAVVGAERDGEPTARRAGSAYHFERMDGTWDRRAKLAPETGRPEDSFGSSVAVAGNGAVVGAPDHDSPDRPTGGAAFVFGL